MRYQIDRDIRQPAYMQLYLQLRHDITAGAYRYGMHLPSKRVLAGETGVSVITVQHAYELLADEGYVQAKERSGFFVCYLEAVRAVPERKDPTLTPPDEDAHILPVSDHRKADLQQSEADEPFPFSVLARTMRRVLTQYGERVMACSPMEGIPELRRVLAAYLARGRGIMVSPEQILIGSGAEDLYGMIVQMLGRERLYGIEDPSYGKIRAIYEADGATCDALRLGTDGIQDTELIRTEAGVLHVTPFNSYPSKVTASASKRMQYISWARERDAVIIEDDYDSEFSQLTKHEETLFSLEPQRTVIYVNTFSRTIASSMRMGYMVLPAARTKELKEKIDFYTCSVPVFEQYVLAELIEKGDFERHINRVRRARRRSAAD